MASHVTIQTSRGVRRIKVSPNDEAAVREAIERSFPGATVVKIEPYISTPIGRKLADAKPIADAEEAARRPKKKDPDAV